MNDWTHGYVADVNYTYSYCNELNPHRIPLLFLNAGLAFPRISTACELGFGEGISVTIHAVCTGCLWYGTDFNPAHTAFAESVMAACGTEAKLFDQSFDEFCNRTDLPDFDFVGLHGVWSWISDENRRVIVDFLRRKLRAGGVVYTGYNTLPGWAAMIPMRRLMVEHMNVMIPPASGRIRRIDSALDFAEKLCALDPLFVRVNPTIGDRINAMKHQHRSYLAHEYFNRDWLPMSFAEMTECLAAAKLTYACSAHFLDHVEAINLTTAQQAFLAEIPDAMFRQSVRDIIINQHFRRDYWVKGPRWLSQVEQAEALACQQVVLITDPSTITFDVTGALGQTGLSEAIYAPIIELLSSHKPFTLGEIAQAVAGTGLSGVQLYAALLVLAGKGVLAPACDEAALEKTKAQSVKLNLFLLEKARGNPELNHLASPVTGGGIPLSRFHQLFLLARSQGWNTPSDWAEAVLQVLAAQGEHLLKDGNPLQTAEENLAELADEASLFATKLLPVLQALQVA
jgi:hypothetical protein